MLKEIVYWMLKPMAYWMLKEIVYWMLYRMLKPMVCSNLRFLLYYHSTHAWTQNFDLLLVDPLSHCHNVHRSGYS
jgi:hypothetical protein